MPDFPLDPTGCTAGHGWRPLKVRADTPIQKGWDVYDLQCKLKYIGFDIVTDGVFGKKTAGTVKGFQAEVAPAAGPIDGIAGTKTQIELGAKASVHGNLPERVRGQMEKESSFLCGIYTPVYTSGATAGYQDTGPVQRNTKYHPKLNENFDVAYSIPLLVSVIKRQHKQYVDWGVVDKRAWEAAQGYWNSQVYAGRYAKGESVPQSFLDYIEAVTTYA
jgi:peptidoglycan hydrolase-like protein with peptidoglycan-binding domain